MRVGRLKCLFVILFGLSSILLFSQNSSFSFVYEGPTDIFVGEDCEATLSWGHPNTPIAISNLPNGEIVSFEIFSISGGYTLDGQVPPGALVTILYQATDNFNNTALFGFSIRVVDQTAPVLDESSLPPDIIIACVGDVPLPAEVTGTDNCVSPENLFVTFTEDGSADLCEGGVITRTWVVDDDFGNFSTHIQSITVLPDTTSPNIIQAPADGSGACDNAMELYSNWIEEQRSMFTANDAGCGIVNYSDNAPDPNILVDFCGEIPVLFTASDDCGNSATVTATFSISNAIAPTITTQASDEMASCANGSPDVAFQAWISNHGGAEAVDDCGSVIWTTNPENPTLQDTCAMNRMIEFIADDGCGNTSSTIATFTVIDTTGPTITMEAQNRIVTCSSSDVDFELASWLETFGNALATDLCTQTEDLIVEYMIGGVALDSAGVFQTLQDSIESGCRDGVIIGGIIFNDMLALLEVEFVFKDQCGNGTGTTGLFGLLEGLAPVIVAPAEDIVISCETGVSVEEAFSIWYNAAGNAIAEDDCGAIAWRGEPVFEEALDQLNAALDTACGTNAVVQVSFFASDFCGLETDTATVASFGLVDTMPPLLTTPASDFLFNCDTAISFALNNWLDALGGAVASDDCTSLLWKFQFVNAQGDTIFGIPFQGPYPDIGELDCSEPNTFTFIGSDFCENEVQSSAQFIVIDTIPPVIILETDSLAVSCEDIPGPDDLNVSDNCPGGDLTIMVRDTILTDTMMIDCAGFTILREWLAIDGCGNIAIDTLFLLVSDEIAPTFIVPADTLLTCQNPDSLDTGLPSQILDNCDLTPTVAFQDSTVTAGCNLIIFRRWIVSDDCGNMSSAVQQISLIDTLPPVISACIDSLVVPLEMDTCAGKVSIDVPIAEDDCSPSDSILYRFSVDGASFISLDSTESAVLLLSAGTHFIDWEVVDCSGNIATCATIVAVDAPLLPEVICSGNIEAEALDSCAQMVMIPTPQRITNSCASTDLTLSVLVEGATLVDQSIISLEADSVPLLFNIGTSIVSFIIEDGAGNKDTCSIEVIVSDLKEPSAQCRDFEIVVDPSGLNSHSISYAEIDNGSFDNCEIDSFVLQPLSIGCEFTGTIQEVQLHVFDGAGNRDSCVAKVLVNGISFTPSFSVNICDADTLALFANPPDTATHLYTYLWTGPNAFSSVDQNPVITDIDSTLSGAYYITITGQTGCSINDSVNVVINNLNLPKISADENMICVGDTIHLIGSDYSEDVIYEWFIGTYPNGILVDTTTSPEIYIASEMSGSNTYYLIVSSKDCMVGPSDSIQIHVNEMPQALLGNTDLSLCQGDSIRLQSLTSSPGIEYFWNGPDGFESNMQNPTPFLATPEASGTYDLHVSQNGCFSDTVSVDIAVNIAPGKPIIAGKDLFCNGGDLELINTEASEEDSLIWIGPNGNHIVTVNDTLLIEQIDLSVSGNWQVIVLSNGCPSDTSDVFTVVLELADDLIASNDGPICRGEGITISVSEQLPGATYNWSGPDDFSSVEPENLISPAVEGIYQLTVFTSGGCEVDLITEVFVLDAPVIDSIAAELNACVDSTSDGTLIPIITSSGSGENIFNWSGPGVTSNDSIFVIERITAQNNGIYFLSVSAQGCTSQLDSISIQVNDIPPQPQISGEATLCAGDSLIIQSSTVYPEGTEYSWFTPEGNILIEDNPLLVISSVDESASGPYVLFVTVDGCESVPSDTIHVNVIASIMTPQIQASSRVCEGDSIFLSVIGGPDSIGTYLWTGPSGFSAETSEPVIFPASELAEGDYFVELLIGPCRSVSSNAFFIEVVPRPKTPVIEADLMGICLDNAFPLNLCIQDSTLIPGAIYTWANAADGSLIGTSMGKCFELTDFTDFVEGSNSVIVETEIEGCTSFTSAGSAFEGYRIPEETANAGPDQSVCVGDEPIADALPVSLSQGIWTSPNDAIVFENDQNQSTPVLGLPEGLNAVVWTLSYEACIDFSSDTALIFVEPFPTILNDTISVDFGQTANFNVIFNDLVPEAYSLNVVSQPVKGNTLYRGDGDFVYTPNIGFVGEDSFAYEICSDICPDQCESANVILIVGDENDCFVPTIFTPNSDGVNDRLIIPCLEAERFPQNRVIIFNQWGDEVFNASPYRNDWEGTRKGKDLPVATYYFIVDFGDGSDVRKGFLVLER